MASWERDHTTDPALKQLAFDIETTQLQQIGRMQGWLGLWGAAADPPGGRHMAWMASPPDARPRRDRGGVDTMPAWRRRTSSAPCARPPASRWTCCSCSSCCATTRAA